MKEHCLPLSSTPPTQRERPTVHKAPPSLSLLIRPVRLQLVGGGTARLAIATLRSQRKHTHTLAQRRAMCSVEQAELEAKDLITEYLTARGYLQSFASFQTEWEHRNRTPQPQGPSPHSELLVAFECGEREVFFALWDAHVPSPLRTSDATCQHLEFSLAVYFAIHPIRTSSGDRQQAMAEFRSYLESRGAELAQSQELATYFALPYIPDPTLHPSFKNLFLDSWSAEVKGRLVQFLGFTLPPPSDAPRLVAMVMNSRKVGAMVARDDGRLAELQASYHTLVAITMELVGALESSVAGKMVSPDYIRSLCNRLFQNSTPEPVAMATPAEQPRPSTSTSELRASVMSLRQSACMVAEVEPPLLNFDKIKNDLTSATTSNETKALLIQALRWRVTRSLPGLQRTTALTALIQEDLLGCKGGGDHQELIIELMSSSDDVIREQLARLFNALASTSGGRGYLAQATPTIQALLHMMYQENEDSHTLRNALGALQKLSLRGVICDALIEGSALQFLLEQLLSQPAGLSEYTLRYAVAFLMNMALRPAGRERCVLQGEQTMHLLADLLEYDSAEMVSYVNGILYSLFQVASLRDEARKQGIGGLLAGALQTCPPDMQGQIEFVLKQLDSHDLEPINGDLGNDDDEEDEEDPETIEGDEEELMIETSEANGEPLLVRDYLAEGPTAQQPSLSSQLPPPGLPYVRPVTPQSFRPHSSAAAVASDQRVVVSAGHRDDDDTRRPQTANASSST